jgi:uncharacterized protein YdeI (YjbR/CyaY-like superfamily)
MVMEERKGVAAIHCKTRKDWRQWLQKNHATAQAVWLIIYKKESGMDSVYYPEAVDEALCFGWVDSLPNKRDAISYYQYFSKRKPKSNWSLVNKEKVAKLMEQGLMAPAGLAMVELAKQTGTWTALDDVAQNRVPKDMEALLDADAVAAANWNHFPPSVKRGILEWILNAKKPETRKLRLEETVRLAAQNIRANQYQPK